MALYQEAIKLKYNVRPEAKKPEKKGLTREYTGALTLQEYEKRKK